MNTNRTCAEANATVGVKGCRAWRLNSFPTFSSATASVAVLSRTRRRGLHGAPATGRRFPLPLGLAQFGQSPASHAAFTVSARVSAARAASDADIDSRRDRLARRFPALENVPVGEHQRWLETQTARPAHERAARVAITKPALFRRHRVGEATSRLLGGAACRSGLL